MTRHGKNSTASAVYTYHERHQDSNSGGYGTRSIRLGADSQKDFDACCLTLHPCRDPVLTPEGYLYDREPLLEFVLHEKIAIQRRLKRFERNQQKESAQLAELAAAEKRDREEKFVRHHNSLAATSSSSSGSSSTSRVGSQIDPSRLAGSEATATLTASTSSGRSQERDPKALPSFWVPSMTPSAGGSKADDESSGPGPASSKPDTVVRCPMSGRPIKVKNLLPVKFSLINPTDELGSPALLAKRERYKCAVTGDVLSNATACAYLRTSGNVVTWDCVQRLIKRDMIDPTNGKPLTERDIIRLQMGGTGFSATNNVMAETKNPSQMA